MLKIPDKKKTEPTDINSTDSFGDQLGIEEPPVEKVVEHHQAGKKYDEIMDSLSQEGHGNQEISSAIGQAKLAKQED